MSYASFAERLSKARTVESDKAAFDRAVNDYFEAVKSQDMEAILVQRESDAMAFKFGTPSRSSVYRKAIGICRQLDSEHSIKGYVDRVAAIYAELNGGKSEVSMTKGLDHEPILIDSVKKRKIGFGTE